MKSEKVKFRKRKALISSVLFIVLAFAIVSIGCASADLNDGLVAYYPFNGNANDESGNGHNGTVDGATLTTDRFGNASSAYYFDGKDDFIYAPVNINPDIMPSMTMSAWVRADDDSPIMQVISHDNGGYDRSLGIDSRGGGKGWSAFSGSGSVLGYSPVTIGEWVFVAAVYDQNLNTVKLYVNDTIYEEEGNLGLGWDYIHIGSNPSHVEYFAGAIDEVRIYNRALFEADIQEPTEEDADLVVLVGDIDNLGFGYPEGFDVFSGNSTPRHSYPWEPEADDPNGTDRIMVVTSYVGSPPAGKDGYTSTTSRPDNLPQPIDMQYNLSGIQVNAAVLQMFVDDFQSPVWKSQFQVELNGRRAPFLEVVLNSLTQTGPIGKLITIQVPENFLDIVESGNLEIYIDDPTTGAGDGFAIDFVRLLINPHLATHVGSISGTVTDAETGQPLGGANVSASGTVTAITASNGTYVLNVVPAGLAVVTATINGYDSQTLSVDLVAGTNVTLNFTLNPASAPRPTPTIKPRPTPTNVSLAEAVDNTVLSWFTGGDANWSGQTSTYYYDGDAAQSGAISHNQYTWIQTMVSGPGYLSFYWYVSSEANVDCLEFYIDCIKQDTISGDVTWQQESYVIGPGLHMLMWKYTKNGDTNYGSDRGWLDNVTFNASLRSH